MENLKSLLNRLLHWSLLSSRSSPIFCLASFWTSFFFFLHFLCVAVMVLFGCLFFAELLL